MSDPRFFRNYLDLLNEQPMPTGQQQVDPVAAAQENLKRAQENKKNVEAQLAALTQQKQTADAQVAAANQAVQQAQQQKQQMARQPAQAPAQAPSPQGTASSQTPGMA
jgi:chromosome segregation ATPase